jgi:hypothetical protein
MAKCFVLVFVLLALAAPLCAQTPTPTPAPETYSVVANSARVGDLIQIVMMRNQKTCQRIHSQNGQNPWPVPYTCTQVQACAAANPPVVPCDESTNAGRNALRAANVRVYPSGFAGRDEFVSFALAAPQFIDQTNAVPSWQRYVQCLSWQAADAAGKNQMCSQAGLSPDCRLYGPTCL